MRRLPPFRYLLYVLGTVNLVMAAVLVLVSLAFNEGDVVALVFVTLVVNVVCAASVVRQFPGSRS